MQRDTHVRRWHDGDSATAAELVTPSGSRPRPAVPSSIGPPRSIAAAPAGLQRAALSVVQRTAGNAAAGAALQRAPVPVVQGLWGAAQITQAKKAAKKAMDTTDPTLKQYSHIKQRHGSASKAAGAGKFSDDKNIVTWVKQALSGAPRTRAAARAPTSSSWPSRASGGTSTAARRPPSAWSSPAAPVPSS